MDSVVTGTSSANSPAAAYSMTPSERRMACFLLESKLLASGQMKKAVVYAGEQGTSFQGALVRMGLIDARAIARLLAAAPTSEAARLTHEAELDRILSTLNEPDEPVASLTASDDSTASLGTVPSVTIVAPPVAAPRPVGSFKTESKTVEGPRRKIGDYLVAMGFISGEQLEHGLKYGKEKGVLLGSALVTLKYISEEILADQLVKQQLEGRKGAPRKRPKLGEILIEQGLINNEQLTTALDTARKNRQRLGEALMSLGLAKEQDITLALSRQLNLPVVNLSRNPPDPTLLTKIPKRMCEKHQTIPFRLEGKVLTAAMVDPMNILAVDDLQNMTGWTVLPVLVTKSDFDKALMAYYGSEDSPDILENITTPDPSEQSGVHEADSAPIVMLVNKVITMAVQRAASDIHIDPQEDVISFRFRVDGILRDLGLRCPKDLGAAIASRIKIMSSLDIAELRLPQDGKFRLKVETKIIDFRVSTIPTVWGEKVVIRLLDQSKARATIEALGLESNAEAIFRSAIKAANGITLVTGPTGSGKSTTLYAAMLEINDPMVNVTTVEDPVEFTLPGIAQVGVRTNVGLTFASALKSFLRQDPDVIIVGEIRDSETASIALKAAMTGHLVLSTLHTNDAISTIDRLLVMGMDRFILASAVRAVLAQRLVRKLCDRCRKPIPLTEESAKQWEISESMMAEGGHAGKAFSEVTIYEPVGCDKCNEGYRGRIGIYEVLGFDTEMREMIVLGASNWELWEKARSTGMFTLRESAVIRVLKGLTSIDEVKRITVTPPARQRREAYKLKATPGEERAAAEAGAGGGVAMDPHALETMTHLCERLEQLGDRFSGAHPGGAVAPSAPAAPAPLSGLDPGPGLALVAKHMAASVGQIGRDAEASARSLQRAQDVLGKLQAALAPPAGTPRRVAAGDLVGRMNDRLPVLAARLERARGAASSAAGFQLQIKVEPDAPTGWVDPEVLEALLDELLENSMSAMGSGTVRIQVKAAKGTASPMVEIGVVDSGPGLTEASKAFDQPYVSTWKGGAGLGLQVARRLALAMGGTLELLSKPGKGCGARLRLPAAP